MAGGLMVKPAGRVTLTPSEMNAKAAARPSTKLGTNGQKKKPKPMSKRALAALLAVEKREVAVVASQRVVYEPTRFDRAQFSSYLRSGRLDTLGTGRSTRLKTGSI